MDSATQAFMLDIPTERGGVLFDRSHGFRAGVGVRGRKVDWPDAPIWWRDRWETIGPFLALLNNYEWT